MADDQLFNMFPKLKRYNINIVDSTAKGTDYRGGELKGRKLEYYPPDEDYNPKKGFPTVEKLSKDVTNRDVLGEIFSHYLPKVDPVFKATREKFVSSLDEKQKAILYGDYQHQINARLFGDTPPSFDEWLATNGGDAFFRGYVTNQYPQEFYRDDQVKMFGDLVNYLKED